MKTIEEQIRQLEELEKEVAEEHNKRNISALPTTPEIFKKEETQSKDTKNIKCKSREIRLILEVESDLYKDVKELEELDPLFEFNRATLRRIAESYIKERLKKMKD
ncbi:MULTISPECIES: hypothetical protein [Pseudomonas]|jgi:hypothetical protein|uniref:hypothetical protein n=1 Tax=Pseudomonas TaxID=286 RepID=UPI0015E2F2E4|nr:MULTISPECIES: hypothetical protein [Pseudomonas]MBA1300081.1 hypothetical protein [Pseudomonas carnis]MBJ2202961.1 hypothetical protein [Pseudomonas carnis]MBW9243982.1 hypothetical protein [Pseudomonas paracarnis]ULN82676.1 hypothetical protein HXW87_10980 [Pseudomonas sp. Y5-11]